MNFKLSTGAGDNFSTVAAKAKEIAKDKNVTVEFDFNGVVCLVDKETNLDYLYRDYSNSWTMEWKTVGANCLKKYPADIKQELTKRKLAAEIESEKRRKQQQIEDDAEKKLVDDSLSGIELEIIPEKLEDYKAYVEKNSKDGYSRGVIDYQEAWAKLMQVEIAKGKTVKECAEETQKGLGYLGITGFMYGCAVNGLAHFWKHGEELRKWHNKEYGVSEDTKGVVNPAVLTINT